jgi:hypothetical protein
VRIYGPVKGLTYLLREDAVATVDELPAVSVFDIVLEEPCAGTEAAGSARS